MLTEAPQERTDLRSGVSVIRSGLVAFAARAQAARDAVRSLDLQYYAWRNDLTGKVLAREVLRAADRGVRVRLLLDDMYAIGGERMLAALDAHPAIEVRLFNPTHWRRFGRLGLVLELLFGGRHLNRRMHNKAWLADGNLAICGGRNIGDEYFDASDAFNFRDMDLAVAGPAARQAQAVFDRYWHHRLAQPVSAVVPSAHRRRGGLRALARRFDAACAAPEAAPFFAGLSDDPGVARVRAQDPSGVTPVAPTALRIQADPPDKASGDALPSEGLAEAILGALRGAEREALLISPYFVPGETATALLEAMARRGLRVSVVTNSLAATDVVAVHGGYARYRERLLEAGVGLHELKPSGDEGATVFGSRGASLHTKAMVIDRARSFVGSFNLDPRSAMLNTEMGVFVDDVAVARQLVEEHARLVDPARSWRVRRAAPGHLAWTAEVGGELVERRGEPDASLGRRVLAWVTRRLPIESQL
ncbi:phospholipase D family protein [Muricoccus vinaceus]|uniref:Phospholipase D n=1 Tax=Muricoccus vinaceus TaxID=424704 RepID=A0ABV6IP45_9PROT